MSVRKCTSGKPAYDYVDGIAVSVAEDEIDRLQQRLARLVEKAEAVTGWCWFEILRYAECDSSEIQANISELEKAIAATKEVITT